MSRPWIVRTQPVGSRWGFWVKSPNNAAIAKSCREYATEEGAVRAALDMLNAWRTNGLDVQDGRS